MKSAFQGRLRKLGLGLLLLAILLSCVWQASASGWIYIARSFGEWQFYILAEGDDFSAWRFKPASADRENKTDVHLWPAKDDKIAMPGIIKTVVDFKAGLGKGAPCGGARDSADDPFRRPTEASSITISYWILILPISVAAGAMLLWGPRMNLRVA